MKIDVSSYEMISGAFQPIGKNHSVTVIMEDVSSGEDRFLKIDRKTKGDKESPLWNTRSKVIYWWTATEVDEERAYMIVYDGKVWPQQKRFAPAYFSFRAVRDVRD